MDRVAEIFKKAVDHLRSIANDVVSVLKKSQDATTEAVKGIKIPAVDFSPLVKAIKEKEGVESVAIKNPEAITSDIKKSLSDVVEALKGIDNQVVVNNDYGTIEQLLKEMKEDKTLIEAVNKYLDKPEREDIDYSSLLIDIRSAMGNEDVVDALKKIIDKDYRVALPEVYPVDIDPNLIEESRIKVKLSDKQLSAISAVAAFSKDGLATEAKQDDIILAIQNQTPPAGGATEVKQDDIITAVGTVSTNVQGNQPRDVSKLVTPMTISLAASGNVKVPASGKKLRIYSINFSLSADMTDISFRFTSGGADFSKFLAPKSGGYYGKDGKQRYYEGGIDQALYCVITGSGNVQINIDYLEI